MRQKVKPGEMIERCPYCAELLAIPAPEEGGPFAGELIRCSTCGRTFVLELDDMIQNHTHQGTGFGTVLKRLFFGFGAMVTNFTSALLMVLVILFWAFMMSGCSETRYSVCWADSSVNGGGSGEGRRSC